MFLLTDYGTSDFYVGALEGSIYSANPEARISTITHEVATDGNNLGVVLRALGDLAGAKKSYERALVINEKSLPPDQPHIRIAKKNLKILEDAQGSKPSSWKKRIT